MSLTNGNCLHIACAADENYALPLGVTIRSLLNHLAPTSQVRLYVLDGGLSSQSRDRLLRSWQDPRLDVEWRQPDLTLLDNLPVSGHVTRTAYARLLLPAVLPQGLTKVLYLDSDLLIRRDVTELWREPLDGAACLAVADSAAPCIDAEVALANFHACQPHLAAARPIPNYRQLGLDPRAAYFNSGVLGIDLAAWRDEAIVQRALECLERFREQVLWWDQYALNVVLHGRWRPLDLRWNQGAHIYRYPSASESPLGPATHALTRNDPWIVHFTSPLKPWHFESDHPYRRRFLGLVDQTEWSGWRPEKPYRGFAQWLSYEYQRLRERRQQRRKMERARRHRAASRRAA